jgi:hypothetical protein
MNNFCPCGLDDCPLNDVCPVCGSPICNALETTDTNPPTLFGIFDVGERQTRQYKMNKHLILFIYKLMLFTEELLLNQGLPVPDNFVQSKSAVSKIMTLMDHCEMNNMQFRQSVNHYIRRGTIN